MLREYSGWELANTLSATSLKPDLLYFHFSIRQQLSNAFPESPLRIFAYPRQTPHKYWFMFKDNLYIDSYCMLGHDSRTEFELSEYLECLKAFRKAAFGALNSERPHLIIGRQYLIKAYSAVMRGIVKTIHSHEFYMNLFYMTQPQQRAVLDLEVQLPYGYYFENVCPEIDGPFINSTWRHAKTGDLEQTITKLQRLPSVCVRHKKEEERGNEEKKLVAFEMCDPAGFFNNLFVVEEHRRRGLGSAVELHLAQKCIREKMCPFKTVEQGNTAVVKSSLQSPYWIRWEEEDGCPAFVIFQHWEPEEE